MPLSGSENGDSFLLSVLNGGNAPPTVNYHLYNNDPSESYTDTPSTYSEVSDSSYSPQSTPLTGWTVTAATPFSYMTGSTLTFNFAGPDTVYGYYVTDGSGSILLWRERFSGAPLIIGSLGGTINVNPILGLQ